ncbi:hypothetical protein [Caminibacter sp.]
MSFVFAKEDLAGRKLLEFNKENLIKVLKNEVNFKKDKIDINKLYSVLSKECKYIYNGEFSPYSFKPIDPYEEKGICYLLPLLEKITYRYDRIHALGYIGPGEAYIEFPNLKTFAKYNNADGSYEYNYFYIVKTNGIFGEGFGSNPIPKIKFLVLAVGKLKEKNNKTYHEYKLYY